MKKILLLVLIGALHSYYAGAQVGYGPEIGIGSSNMRFIPASVYTTSSANSRFSWRLGAMADLPFTGHIYFQTGLYWSRKGHSRSYSFFVSDSTNDFESRTYVLDYIDLPLSIVFKTNSQGKNRFCLGAGATLSYLISGNSDLSAAVKYNDTLYNIVSSGPATSSLRSFDIGANFFAAYELATGLYFKAYYVTGVKDLSLNSEVSKNRMWGIGAGYFFGRNRNINRDTENLIDKSKD